MAGRSLTASIPGIKVAKLKLERRSLTQTAFAEEIRISWSTVNKFFNGKPVDRRIFIEICEALDLEWEDIVTSPDGEEEGESGRVGEGENSQSLIPNTQSLIPNSSNLISIVHRNSARTRNALNPYILPRIRRAGLLEKCLKSIRRGVQEQKQRIIPILGAAGYGKSTILGNIYDEVNQELEESESGWIALVRCNDLIESIDTFAIELGEKVTDERKLISEIASELTQHHGRGVLLIDTLDLVLEKRLIPVLRNLFQQLIEIGTTVVFTCRYQDFQDFFEPYHESLAGVAQSMERHLVTEFDEVEVREAARAFVQTELKVDSSEAATDFAEKIIALSADSQSLAEITRNPLLLALLCDLFAKEENIPEDLTVSQLYEKYWNYRIAQSRKPREDAQRIGIAKKQLCLGIAQIMYNNSGERLRDFVYESQLELNEIQFFAYAELKSDGVLTAIGGERLVFFHQTFLEYAIARWWNSTPLGEVAKTKALENLRNSENAYVRHYVWSVIRQLLNLVNLAEFYLIAEEFDQRKILPFRATAFAAVSRNEAEASSILLQLLPLSLQLGDAYQDTLLVAAKSAPNRHVDNAWKVILELLQKSGTALTNKIAETAGELLTRLKTATGEQVELALKAVESRPSGKGEKSQEEQLHIFGKLISAYAQTPKTFGHGIDLNVCQALKKQYFRMGSQTRSLAIQLHLTPGVPESTQRELLTTITSRPTHEQFKEKENAIALLQQLLPSLIQSGDSTFGQSWIDALHAPLPKGWDRVQAAVIGEQAVRDSQLLATLINQLFTEDSSYQAQFLSPSPTLPIPPSSSSQDGSRLRRTQMALGEAIKRGAEAAVASTLLAMPISEVPQNRISSLSTLIRELSVAGDKLEAPLRESLAKWILPIASTQPKESISMVDSLSQNSPEVEALLGQLLKQVIPNLEQSEVNLIVKKLIRVPSSLESHLKATPESKEFRVALVRLYQRKAETLSSESAIFNLIQLCLDNSREVALSASGAILALAENQYQISVKDLIEVAANAKIIGVRHNALKALIHILESDGQFPDSELIALCTTLKDERLPEIIQPLYKIIEVWVEKNKKVPSGVANIVFELTAQLTKEKTKEYIDGGIANAAFITLKIIANLEDEGLSLGLSQCTRQLLNATNINRAVDRLFVIGLLERVSRFDHELLSKIVKEDFIRGDKMMPIANQCAVAIAIGYSQGKNALLLEEILRDKRFSSDIKTCIIREREGRK